MHVYLAGFVCIEPYWTSPVDGIWLLSSFLDHWRKRTVSDYVLQERHMLDSGAFTVINDRSRSYAGLDWDSYLTSYIAFVKQTNQRLFFELDIDCVVGYARVLDYTKRIEDEVGRQPIPVWHRERGLDAFLSMCEQYKYVSLGSSKLLAKNPEKFRWFIDEAHKRGAKIHGLGFTAVPWLHRLNFDSVDSSSWLQTGKFGSMVRFVPPADGSDHSTRVRSMHLEGKRLKNSTAGNIYNFQEWVRFQRYAEASL